MTLDELAAAIRENAAEIRAGRTAPDRLPKLAADLDALADEALDIGREHDEAIDAAKEEAGEAREEADGHASRADGLEQSLSDIVEAAVAAREGRPHAAAAVVDMICRRHPEVAQHLPGLTAAARSRPHDYWTYG